MRDELKHLTQEDYWVRGINKRDFHHSVGLVKDMIQARKESFDREIAFLRSKNPDLSTSTINSNAERNEEGNSYLWQFALMRLQEQFEAILKYKLLSQSKKHHSGFGSILKDIKGLGVTISKAEENELQLWARLRNCFTHAPPEAYLAVPLLEKDVEEYAALLISLYCRWCGELGIKEI